MCWPILQVNMLLDQGSLTRGPQTSQKTDTEYKVWSYLAYFEDFYCEFRPAEHFFLGMWPSDKFEFEAPVLDRENLRIRVTATTAF
jgi:hypothetical protein